jgi:predicted nucleic acid-binding protein
VVSNATPLIHLARVGRLSLLKEVFGHLSIPREVHREICEGKETPDALLLKTAVADGWIRVDETRVVGAKRLAEATGVHTGEAAAILLARVNKALLLIDDKMGRTAAELLGVRCIGTIGVHLLALRGGIVTLEDFEASLNGLIDSGFRIDATLYRAVLQKARRISARDNG